MAVSEGHRNRVESAGLPAQMSVSILWILIQPKKKLVSSVLTSYNPFLLWVVELSLFLADLVQYALYYLVQNGLANLALRDQQICYQKYLK